MLIGHWKLDGSAQDSSGNENHGTTSSVLYGQGIIDDGTAMKSGHITIPNSDSLQVINDYTIAFWFKPNSAGERRTIIDKAYGGEFTINHETEGDLRFYHGEAGGNSSPYESLDSEVLSNNVWTHCAIVYIYNEKRSIWYLNGRFSSTRVGSYNPSPSTNPVKIGIGYTGHPVDGSIDDVRIYNHALSKRDIGWLSEPKSLSIKQEQEINDEKKLHFSFDTQPESMENLVPAGERTCDEPFSREGSHVDTYSYSQENGYTRMYIDPTAGEEPYADWGFYAHKPGGSDVGDVYVISFKYKIIKNTANPPYLQMAYRDGYKNPEHANFADLNEETRVYLGDGWFQYSVKATILEAGNTWWRFGQRSNGIETEFYVDDFQVELGDEMTPFTDGSRVGIVKDYSGNNANTTLEPSSAPTWVSDGRVGVGAYDFNEGDAIHVPDINSGKTNNYTVLAWIKPYAATDQRAPIVRIDRWYFQVFENNRLATYWYGRDPSGYHYSNKNSITMNVWQHVCVVWSDDDIKFYINGAPDTTISSVLGVGDFNSWVRVGFESNVRRYHGMIDDVRIYERVLSDEEIWNVYNRTTHMSIDKNSNVWTHTLTKDLAKPLSIGGTQTTKNEHTGNTNVSIRKDGLYANKIIRY